MIGPSPVLRHKQFPFHLDFPLAKASVVIRTCQLWHCWRNCLPTPAWLLMGPPCCLSTKHSLHNWMTKSYRKEIYTMPWLNRNYIPQYKKINKKNILVTHPYHLTTCRNKLWEINNFDHHLPTDLRSYCIEQIVKTMLI